MEATAHGTLDLTDETRAVLDALPVAISAGAAIRDAAGRIVDLRTIFVNAAAERVTGVPRERLVGVRLGEAVQGFTESELFARVVRLIETGGRSRWKSASSGRTARCGSCAAAGG